MGVSDMVTKAKGLIENLTVDEVAAEIETDGTVLVDIREPDEATSDGTIPGSVWAPRGMIEYHADPTTPYHMAEFTPDRRIILYCKSGGRSALAAATLREMGYRNVAHLDGGINAWKDAQRPIRVTA
jgi:rhodanese-related sulfurtransferase